MHAVEALFAGVRGAENGTARIYTRGTTTPATWYEDFEGTVAASGTVTLDDSGRAEVYVNSLVDVVVYDADGTELFSYTPAVSTPDVEYQGSAFSGTNYTSGATGSGSGYAVSLHTILGRFLTSFGTTDANVLLDGAATSLQNALGALAGLLYNVKSPVYGAAGDGVVDDTSAIAAAISAANAAGGGIVFVPEGTYRITSVLTLPASVSLVGVGSGASIITVDHATADALSFTGNDSYASRVLHGIRVTAAQSNSGTCLTTASGTQVAVSNCYFGGANNTGTLSSLAGNTTLTSVWFTCATTSTSSMATGSIASARECIFNAPATYNPTNGVVYVSAAYMDGCTFRNTSCTSGTYTCIKFSSTTVYGRFSRTSFSASGGATVTAFTLGTYVAASDFEEHQSLFGTSVTAYSYTFAAANSGAKVVLGTRESRVYNLSTASTTPAIPVSQYGRIAVVTTAAGNTTFTIDGDPPEGAHGSITFHNRDGSPRTFNFPALFYATTGGIAKSITNNYVFTAHYVVAVVNGPTTVAPVDWSD